MKTILATAAAIITVGISQFAGAAVTITFTQSGNDVIVTTTGTLDLTGATKATQNVVLGANQQIAGTITFGSGTDQQVDLFRLTRVTRHTISGSSIGTLNSWTSTFTDASASNATVALNSVRFAQDSTSDGSVPNNNRVFVDDAVAVGDILNLNGSATYANKTLADFSLTAGTNFLWLQNTAAAGEAGKVYITAVPEPGSLILLGMGGLLLMRRRRSKAPLAV